ncbi:MAG: DUF4976 domain-containing protein, partial [Acidimicrobiia bacterium]|nr:DUF4976 domain-containing protein [Acidimicrobiia bacterium]
DFLDDNDLTENTVVVYTSDQGFFLGDHGWFDKRFMYEESMAMPLLIRYPQEVEAGMACEDIVLNVDFAPTFLDLCGLPIPDEMQGASFRALLGGDRPAGWQQSMYYRYWMHRDSAHNVPAHYGVLTMRHKLIHYYNDPLGQPGAHGPADPPEWELYDLEADPFEIDNIYNRAENAQLIAQLEDELARLQSLVGDKPYAP